MVDKSKDMKLVQNSKNHLTNTYDPAGNLIERHNAIGAETQYSFDEMNRMTGITYPDTSTVHYAYNAVGLRTLVSNAVAQINYTYGSMNQMISSVPRISNYEYSNVQNFVACPLFVLP